ncbi:MAG: hypothetical protein JWM47_3100 [Acidimicrobiales bacterium]|nr:hypothetical protein [Acidimicrobiales bacterium]
MGPHGEGRGAPDKCRARRCATDHQARAIVASSWRGLWSTVHGHPRRRGTHLPDRDGASGRRARHSSNACRAAGEAGGTSIAGFLKGWRSAGGIVQLSARRAAAARSGGRRSGGTACELLLRGRVRPGGRPGGRGAGGDRVARRPGHRSRAGRSEGCTCGAPPSAQRKPCLRLVRNLGEADRWPHHPALLERRPRWRRRLLDGDIARRSLPPLRTTLRLEDKPDIPETAPSSISCKRCGRR